MSAPAYLGLTWDHPRGRTALRRAAEQRAPGLIGWDVQPLEGFESAPIGELCARYDLVVMDHPHLGEALSQGCLQPLDSIFDRKTLDGIRAVAIGPSYDSYAMNGRQWALPLDAATQVMAARADLIGADLPRDMKEVIALAEATGRVAMSIAGPHAILSFLSLCSAIDPGLDLRDSDTWPAPDVAREAYALLALLYPLTPPDTHGLNPIGLLDRMTAGDDILLVPHVYGYVNYSAPGLPRRVSFADAPCVGTGGRPGSILGGTGIAISARCAVNDDLRNHLVWLLSADAQHGHIPLNDGQPSLRSAWTDAQVNNHWGNFYLDTLTTIERSTVRPRHNGYIAFQAQASARLRDALRTAAEPETFCAWVSDTYIRSGGKTGDAS